MERKIKFFDTTLRDGEQSPGCSMNLQEKIEVAHRLKIHVRETDTVARLGGDEFVVMLEDLAEDFAMAVSEAEKMAKHLISVVQHE